MKVKQISAGVLAVLFSSFAVSPLSYSFEDSLSRGGSSAGEARATFTNFNIFLIEVFLSKLTDRPFSSDSLPGNLVLVRKQRATLRTTEHPHLKSLCCPIISGEVRAEYYPALSFLKLRHVSNKQIRRLAASFSGLSPPSFLSS